MKKIYLLILAVFVGVSILYSLNASNSFRIILQLLGAIIIAGEYYKVIHQKEDIVSDTDYPAMFILKCMI